MEFPPSVYFSQCGNANKEHKKEPNKTERVRENSSQVSPFFTILVACSNLGSYACCDVW